MGATPTGAPTELPTTGTSQHMLAVYAGGAPGTDTASKALEWAKGAGFNAVLNYSVVNASPEDIKSYLEQSLGLKVIFSLKDLLGPQDLDTDTGDQALHQQFGMNTHDQVSDLVRRFAEHPAVWGFYVSDELPEDASKLAVWLPLLRERQQEIKAITAKPVLVTLYWSGADTAFYKAVKSATTDLAIDYYPYPANSTYGSGAERIIGRTLKTVAGSNSWFVLQAFGWGNGQHSEGAGLGFSANAAPPNTDQMVSMARSAVLGGARNVIMYSYDDNVSNPAQLKNISAAVSQITGAAWWQH